MAKRRKKRGRKTVADRKRELTRQAENIYFGHPIPPVDLPRARRVLKAVQRSRVWRGFFAGRCGPATVALNEVLFDGRGTYVVVIDRTARNMFPRRWSGHVAVCYDDQLYDYQGQIEWGKFARWYGDDIDPRDRPTLMLDVTLAEVKRHFVDPCELTASRAGQWVERAKSCLERAKSKDVEAERRAAQGQPPRFQIVAVRR